jgi:hypothetical protein
VKLLNVRLGAEDARMAAHLRRGGIPISGIVRAAIRAAYERHAGRRATRGRASEIMAEIYREHPDPPDFPRGKSIARDRRRVRREIRDRLRRRRS